MTVSFGQRNQHSTVERTSSNAQETNQPSIRNDLASQLNQNPDEAINQEVDGGKIKSYFIGCIAGFTFSVIVMGLIKGANAPGGFGSQLFLNIASGMVMMTIAPMLLIPARILADVMRGLQIPRGYSDIFIGLLLGSIMFLPEIATGDAIKWEKIAFIIGGGIGGFTYWRSRGFPGLKSKHNVIANLANRSLRRF